MKTKLFISLFLFISSITIGQTNVIQVRKVTYDTSFYTKKTYDTAFTVKSNRFNISPNFTEERTGYWKNNVFFDTDSLYVFTRPITNRQAKLATKNPKKFWEKIDRKKRKNKCGVYAIAYNFYEAITTYQIDTITTTHYQIRNNSTNEITRNENIAVFTDTTSFDLVYKQYWYISDYDSILLNTTKEGFEFCGGLQEGRIQCLFISLTTSLEDNYERNRAFGFYRYSGKINDKRCQMFLNFESHLIRKAVIIENNERNFVTIISGSFNHNKQIKNWEYKRRHKHSANSIIISGNYKNGYKIGTWSFNKIYEPFMNENNEDNISQNIYSIEFKKDTISLCSIFTITF